MSDHAVGVAWMNEVERQLQEGNMDSYYNKAGQASCFQRPTAPPAIDWSKPIRTVPSGNPASSVLVGGTRIVTWNGYSAAVVDDFGRQFQSGLFGFVTYPEGYRLVENVPEEPKDHVILWACEDEDDWELQSDPGELYTKAQAEKILASERTIYSGMRYVLVKVPVL